MKKNDRMAFLTILLTIISVSIVMVSLPTANPSEDFSEDLNLSASSTNYTIGVLPNEEYAWIITSIRENDLELIFGSIWTDIFCLPDDPQIGYKLKANVTSTQNNGTHLIIDYARWDCLYRANNFSINPNESCVYTYPSDPQNYTKFDSIFPFFLPTPLVSYIFDSDLGSIYDAGDFTSYGGGLNVYYNLQLNINGSVIDVSGIASYFENGVLDYYRFGYQNGSERVECLVVETIQQYHLEQISIGCEVGDEFTWVLVNYNLPTLEYFFGEEFFERFGLLPDPERMHSIKMKVDGASENDTSLRLDYSLYDWTALEDSFPEVPIKNSSYSFAKEPFAEFKTTNGQIALVIPQPTELFLRYGRYGDQYAPYYELYSSINLRFTQGEDTLHGLVFYNRVGVLTTLILSRSVEIDGRTELDIAFEIALYYNTPTPDYVEIEEGVTLNYDIYTNRSIYLNLAVPTMNYQNATVEVLKIFGEDEDAGRTPFIANFSMQGDYNLWGVEEVLIVGYIHNDSKMYFDPLVISSIGPFYLAPLFVNNRMNWTEFSNSYNNYSMVKNSDWYSVSELNSGFNFYQIDFVKNITFSHIYNETGFLSEYIVYYNGQLIHNCSVRKITIPPLVNDTQSPVITVTTPNIGDMCGVFPLKFNFTIEEEHLNCSWITISDGILEHTQDLSVTTSDFTGQINDTAWDSLSDGNITIRIYANDSSGNLNGVEIIIIKDSTDPIVSILNIVSNQMFNGTPPEFILEITEFRLNFTWYTVNGSEEKYFTGIFGTIDKEMWDSLSNGSVLVQFFALDEVGNLGTAQVIVIKHIEFENLPPPVEPDDPVEPEVLEDLLTFIFVPLSLGMVGIVIIALLVSRKRK